MLFDGTDDALSGAFGGGTGLGGNASKVLFAVTEPTALASLDHIVFHYGAQVEGASFGLSFHNAALTVFQWGGSAYDVTDPVGSSPTVQVDTAVKQGDELSLYIDGEPRIGPVTKAPASVSQSAFTLGARLDGLFPFAGRVGEVLLYSGTLSTGERYRIESCLRQKWANQALPTLTPTP